MEIQPRDNEHGDLVKPSHWYSISGRCSIGLKHRSRYIALIPLSRYNEPKPVERRSQWWWGYDDVRSSNFGDELRKLSFYQAERFTHQIEP